MRPATFLMIPHAPGGTLAHLAACLAVAGALRDRGHEVIFAYGGSRPELLERAGFEWHPAVEAAAQLSSGTGGSGPAVAAVGAAGVRGRPVATLAYGVRRVRRAPLL